ncbi:AAA family ATPase [Agrobacterium pusense]|uniref:AAA family ATPase n=1 Tax=Agrobacterium pusense TaxID=648995 RepID=UPI001C9E455D|nr:ATP-binding protein [Agrobacterium pusense]
MKAVERRFAYASRLSDPSEDNNVFSSAAEDRKARSISQKGNAGKSSETRKLVGLPRTNSNGSELFEVIEPLHSAKDIVLDRENFRLLTGVVEEFRRGDDLRRYGLVPRSKLLFCGPPGCGKTLCAEVLAYEMKMPLIVARLDGIITTYLGETASNLRKMFDAAQSGSAVLFLDEFDALARTRSDASEHNEIRRVVNSLLKLIDDFHGRGILVAATNLQSTIDAAAWRRFDEVILFKRPTKLQIKRLLEIKLRNFETTLSFDEFLEDLNGMSYAEIERICISAIKREIINRKSTLSKHTFKSSILDEKRRIAIRGSISNPE